MKVFRRHSASRARAQPGCRTVFRRVGFLAPSIAATLIAAGCASRPTNEAIAQVDPESGYRPALLIQRRADNDPSTLFVLSFSGGGTRAAALSYGVLEELHRTPVVIDGRRRSMVDEVDVITGVSGGSFTALSFALYGDRLFSEYEERFLKRNVQGALIRRFLNPINWWKFVGGSAGRSELAAEYYDEILFDEATYADLMARPGPVAIATSTDISTGSRLAFFQNDFDLLCSDLGELRLSRAVTASSAVPGVFSPITLDNHGGNCGYEYPAWVGDVTHPEDPTEQTGRAIQRYREMREFQDSAGRPYIHLEDGGVADNIGVRGVLEGIYELEASPAFRSDSGFNVIRRIALVVVNAQSNPSTDWDKKESPPGLFTLLSRSASVPIERYSFETIELMKDRAESIAWRRSLLVAKARLAGATEAEAEASIPRLDLHVLDISFDAIRDPQEREYFMNLPTSFVLPDEAVDRLREIAGRLLRESIQYQSLLRDLDES